MTPDDPKPADRPLSPEEDAKRKEDQLRIAERRLVDEMARHRRDEQRELQRFRYGCIGVIVALVVLLVIGLLFF
jgi:hypothetical protein